MSKIYATRQSLYYDELQTRQLRDMLQNVVPEIELNDTDIGILEEISTNGRATTTLLSDVLDVSRPYAGDRVRRLREHEYLSEVAPNLYDITEKGDSALEEADKDG